MDFKTKEDIREYLRHQASHSSDDFVWVRFHGDAKLGDISLAGEEVAESGDPYSWIRDTLDDFEGEPLVDEYVEEITDGDYEIVDAEGYVNEFCDFNHWGSCDWDEYKEFLDQNDDRDMLIAARDCGIPMENAGEAYQGQWNDDSDFAYDLIHDCYDLKDVPSIVICHIDWDAVGRDLMCDYHSSNGYYFNANY